MNSLDLSPDLEALLEVANVHERIDPPCEPLLVSNFSYELAQDLSLIESATED